MSAPQITEMHEGGLATELGIHNSEIRMHFCVHGIFGKHLWSANFVFIHFALLVAGTGQFNLEPRTWNSDQSIGTL